ncbi:unnamed protein product [Prorocentrum cordatum]|uniref:Protein kinase domain-containing protein n=1 Tax=Prorocentrum cordatum TaxID=2364126 RepID=A0ABN9TW78_9DINO|nr:unnamed protein product [Polarella glacialis]
MAPELHALPVHRQGYGFPVDVWATGVSMYCVMFGGRHPFTNTAGLLDLRLLCQASMDFREPGMKGTLGGLRFSDEARQLCRWMVAVDPVRRMSARDACVAAAAWVSKTPALLQSRARQPRGASEVGRLDLGALVEARGCDAGEAAQLATPRALEKVGGFKKVKEDDPALGDLWPPQRDLLGARVGQSLEAARQSVNPSGSSRPAWLVTGRLGLACPAEFAGRAGDKKSNKCTNKKEQDGGGGGGGLRNHSDGSSPPRPCQELLMAFGLPSSGVRVELRRGRRRDARGGFGRDQRVRGLSLLALPWAPRGWVDGPSLAAPFAGRHWQLVRQLGDRYPGRRRAGKSMPLPSGGVADTHWTATGLMGDSHVGTSANFEGRFALATANLDIPFSSATILPGGASRA